jgi:small subunit ribosomal protein S1
VTSRDVEAPSTTAEQPPDRDPQPVEEAASPSEELPTSDATRIEAPEGGSDEERLATAVQPATEHLEPPTGTEKAQARESEVVQTLRRAMDEKSEIEGRVIGWNNGGFHVVVGSTTAFCPRSEMELGVAKDPGEYLDKTFAFQVLRVQKKGRRVVLSRAALLRGERARVRSEAREKLSVGSVVSGVVASLTDFGAFIDLGGVQGLLHVSEMSRHRIDHPSDHLQVGQEVEVKILKLEKGGRRISLSMRALEPDPWKGIQDRFPEGSVVNGTVEKTTSFGAFIQLEPGLTGLLPASALALPRDASLARVYPPGKELRVQVVAVDPRRQRISLTLEGSALEGSRNDYQAYLREQRQSDSAKGFNALADAFRKLETDGE